MESREPPLLVFVFLRLLQNLVVHDDVVILLGVSHGGDSDCMLMFCVKKTWTSEERITYRPIYRQIDSCKYFIT